MPGEEQKHVRLEVLNDLNTQITAVLRDVMLCNLVDSAFEILRTEACLMR
jgi:hypothetical protein